MLKNRFSVELRHSASLLMSATLLFVCADSLIAQVGPPYRDSGGFSPAMPGSNPGMIGGGSGPFGPNPSALGAGTSIDRPGGISSNGAPPLGMGLNPSGLNLSPGVSPGTEAQGSRGADLFQRESGRPIAEVRFVGQETVSIDKIMSFVRTREGRNFEPEVLQADKRRLTSSGLFRDVRIYTRDEPIGLVVVFEVFERPTIRHIRFIGNRGISDRTLKTQSGLEVGESLNLYTIEEARRKIEDYYRSRGFPKAIVEISEGNEPSHRGAVFDISEGPKQHLLAVEFVGNTIASDSRLETQIQSRPDIIPRLALFRGKLDMNKVDEDVERLTAYYRGLGFFRARIGRELEYDSTESWATLRFIIDEGPRYTVREVSVSGNAVFESEGLKSKLMLKTGDFFNLERMNRDVNTLRDTYGAQGYVFADITADPIFAEAGSELDLIYNVSEGQQFRVGNIHVHVGGEYAHTRETVILDRLSLRPGDIVDVREVRASERRLKASQLFENDPASGKTPRIVIRPPDLSDIEVAAEERSGQAVRGQSPETEPPMEAPARPTPSWPWPVGASFPPATRP
jgi:outer membrane protein insertion porin family